MLWSLIIFCSVEEKVIVIETEGIMKAKMREEGLS